MVRWDFADTMGRCEFHSQNQRDSMDCVLKQKILLENVQQTQYMIDQRDSLKYGIDKNESGKLENGFMDQIQSQDISSVMMDLCHILLMHWERQMMDLCEILLMH